MIRAIVGNILSIEEGTVAIGPSLDETPVLGPAGIRCAFAMRKDGVCMAVSAFEQRDDSFPILSLLRAKQKAESIHPRREFPEPDPRRWLAKWIPKQ